MSAVTYSLAKVHGRQRLVCDHNAERICDDCKKQYERDKSNRWCANNPEKVRGRNQRWYAKHGSAYHHRRYLTGAIDDWQSENPERVHENKMKHKHKVRGIVFWPGQTRAILKASATHCDICKRDLATVTKGGVHLDHDHHLPVGQPNVRGMLCRRCNQLLGAVDDSIELLEAHIQYLRRWRERLAEVA